MRSLMFLLVLVLFCSVRETSSTPTAIRSAQSVCCIGKFTDVKIPVRKIVSYQWTNSDCPTRAIVFKTVGGKDICVDPKDTFVSRQVDKMDKRTSSATTATYASTSAKTKASESTSAKTKASASTSATTTAASTAETPQFK